MSRTMLASPETLVSTHPAPSIELATPHRRTGVDADLLMMPTLAGNGDVAPVPKVSTIAVTVSITCTTTISSLLNGILTVGIPVISRDLRIPNSLQLWPASVFALTCGCTLLLCGSAADIVGSRRMYLVGTLLQSIFTLGCGLATSTLQIIVFRGFAGIASSFCLPSAVSIVTNTFPPGNSRNFSFAAMGGGQAVGFGLGLILGGVFSSTIGWRWGFHLATILNTAVLGLAIWALPATIDPVLSKGMWTSLAKDVDWVGATVVGTCLALTSYVFASVTNSELSIREPILIALLTVAVALIPIFIYWMRRQTTHGRPALIPNGLWRNLPFTTICITVFLVWGGFNAVEQLIAFYFELVQEIPALKSSLYLSPVALSGVLANILVGAFLPRMRASIAVPAVCVTAAISPLLLALLSKADIFDYWRGTFVALVLNPMASDVIYTIANLVVSSAFPKETQGLAGGVFNTVSQFGKSVGLATAAVIAGRVTAEAESRASLEGQSVVDLVARQTLLEGYQASWWYCSALQMLAVGVSAWGLRNIGRVGLKED